MTETPPPPPENEVLLAALKHKEIPKRKEALEKIAALEISTPEIIQALEKTAAKDKSKPVREAAIKALLSPANRTAQRKTNAKIPFTIRRQTVSQITTWQEEGLIDENQARLLSQKYNFDFAPRGAITPSALVKSEPKPKRSLSEILLSEGTIQIVLYLGAFFVIAASYIFAAAIDFLRIPILFLVTTGFLGVAIALKKRLSQASFVLFVVFSILLPINAGVIQDSVNFPSALNSPYWIIVAILLTICWGAATWFYNSSFFALLAFAGASWVILLIGNWVDISAHLSLFLWGLLLLGLLGAVKFLIRWKDKDFSKLPFWFLQFMQGFLILASLGNLGGVGSNGWWFIIFFTWLMGSAFFYLSNTIYAFGLFPSLSILLLIPLPWYLLSGFKASESVALIFTMIWGIAFLGTAEYFSSNDNENTNAYRLPLYLGAVFLQIMALVRGNDESDLLGFSLILTATLFYAGLTFYKPRQIMWVITLIGAILTYLKLYTIPPLENYDIFPGFIFLWPALVFLAAELISKHKIKAESKWHTPLMIFGLVLTIISLGGLILLGFDDPLRVTIGTGLLALFSIVYAISHDKAWISYFTAGGIALTLFYLLLHFDIDKWLAPFFILALVYFLPPYLLALFRKLENKWLSTYRISGLLLGVFISFASPVQGGAAAIIVSAMVATMYALEAFRQKNVWLAVPADLLYIGAYFMVLAEFKIDQAQFYSVGAALLGMIMHYLLVKSGSKFGAFVAGMLSQMVLLTTTYGQMVSDESGGIYFFVLFFQALIVLGYGIVIRSRSLVITPIGFIILAVLTVMFNLLDSTFIIFILCFAGFFLILLGIGALFMRERLLKTRDSLKEKISDWQA